MVRRNCARSTKRSCSICKSPHLRNTRRFCSYTCLCRYAPRPAITGAQRANFFDTCALKLRNWAYDLPPELRISRQTESDASNRRPHVYILHMMYHTAQILLARTFLKEKQASPVGSAQNSDAVVQQARRFCYQAARAIVLISRRYQQIFGSFRKSPITANHCSLSAAVALLGLFQVGAIPDASEILGFLNTILDVLGELSTSWDIARRLRNNLLRLFRIKHIPVVGLERPLTQDTPTTPDGNNLPNAPSSSHMAPGHGELDTTLLNGMSSEDSQDFGNWLDMIDDSFFDYAVRNSSV